MKKLYVLLLLGNISVYSQNTSVTTTVTESTDSLGNKTTVTTEQTTAPMITISNGSVFQQQTVLSTKTTTQVASPATPPVLNSPPNQTSQTTVISATIPNNQPTLVSKEIFEQDRLDLVKWEAKDNKYQIIYFDENGLLKVYNATIEPKGYISSRLGGIKHSIPVLWQERRVWPTLSIVTVPVKIRPNILNRGQEANGEISNIGIHYPLMSFTKAKLFYDGKVAKHKWSLGLIAAPMIETFNAGNTNGQKPDEKKQLAISLSTGISYSYNDISFVFIPAGVDYGLTPNGAYWVYHGRYWWGFGLAISPKFLERI